MRPPVVLEMLVVLGVVGLALELAEGHTWVLIASGVAAAIWLLARNH